MRRPIWVLGGAVLCSAWPAAALAHDGGDHTPASLWAAWNWDPWILGSLLVAGALYARGVRLLWSRAGRGRGLPAWRVVAFYGGLSALFAALISPIDWLGSQLFWMHMVQHMLLILVAAPLLVLGVPHLGMLWGLPREGRLGVGRAWRRLWPLHRIQALLLQPALAWSLHVGVLWLWHLPALFEAALADTRVHALEHLTFTGTALLFWWVLLRAGVRRRMGYGGALFYLFAAMTQGTVLGALITFAPTPWYQTYGQTLAGWSLTPLEDQQLAGLVMWIPAGPLYLGVFLLFMARWLRASEQESHRSEPSVWAQLGQARQAEQGEGRHGPDAQAAPTN